MPDLNQDQYSHLIDRVESLEDKLFAVQGAVTATLHALNDHGINLREPVRRALCQAANEMEDDSLAGAAAEIDTFRDFLCDELLRD